MAILWVQNAQHIDLFSNTTATVMANTTTGNLLVASVWAPNQGLDSLARSVSDGTNTFKLAGTESNSNGGTMEIWYATNITGLTTPTVTATRAATSASFNMGIQVVEVSGLAKVQPLDYFASTRMNGPAGNVLTLGGFMPKTPNNFVFFCGAQPGNTLTFVVGSGFANLQQQGTNTDLGRMGSQTQINSSVGVLDARMSGGSSGTAAIVVVAVFSDTDLPSPKSPLKANNYQFLKVGDGMSLSEKIR